MAARATHVGFVSYNRGKIGRSGQLALMSKCNLITPG
jgi:hypothetical protein